MKGWKTVQTFTHGNLACDGRRVRLSISLYVDGVNVAKFGTYDFGTINNPYKPVNMIYSDLHSNLISNQHLIINSEGRIYVYSYEAQTNLRTYLTVDWGLQNPYY